MTSQTWQRSRSAYDVLDRDPQHHPSVEIACKDISSRFLQGLASSDRAAVLGAARVRRFPAATQVTTQGDPAEQVFLLTAGCARYFFLTHGGQKLLLRWFLPGEIFGACALLPSPYSYLVSAETVKNSTALVWDRNTVRRLAAHFPALWENSLAIASEYLTLYVSTHVAIASHNAHTRLSEVLMNLAATIGRPRQNGFELELSDEELANAANVTLFTASRFVARSQRSGALTKSRGKILLHHPERLLAQK